MGPAKGAAGAEERIDEKLDWREQVKKQPVAWSLGAAGGGFLLGYAIAAIVKGEASGRRAGSDFAPSEPHAYGAGPILGQAPHADPELRKYRESTAHREDQQSGQGLLERFQKTAVYDHLRKEAVATGKRFVVELSQTAQEVVLPVAVAWLKQWLTELATETTTGTSTSKSGSTNPPVAGSGEKRATATAGASHPSQPERFSDGRG